MTKKNEVQNEVKRGRGRPRKYTGELEQHIVALIAAVGLTNARKLLTNTGAVRKNFEKQFGVTVDRKLVTGKCNISLFKLCQMGQEAGIKLHRGRPKKVAA